jgi:hypothetical protein
LQKRQHKKKTGHTKRNKKRFVIRKGLYNNPKRHGSPVWLSVAELEKFSRLKV